MAKAGVAPSPDITRLPRRYLIVVEGIPLGSNDRSHWARRAKDTATFRELVHWQAMAMRPLLPLEHARVTITLMHSRYFDQDGAYSHVKPLLDGLIGTLLVNDDCPHCDVRVEQEIGKHRSCRIVVEEML